MKYFLFWTCLRFADQLFVFCWKLSNSILSHCRSTTKVTFFRNILMIFTRPSAGKVVSGRVGCGLGLFLFF